MYCIIIIIIRNGLDDSLWWTFKKELYLQTFVDCQGTLAIGIITSCSSPSGRVSEEQFNFALLGYPFSQLYPFAYSLKSPLSYENHSNQAQPYFCTEYGRIQTCAQKAEKCENLNSEIKVCATNISKGRVTDRFSGGGISSFSSQSFFPGSSEERGEQFSIWPPRNCRHRPESSQYCNRRETCIPWRRISHLSESLTTIHKKTCMPNIPKPTICQPRAFEGWRQE